MCMSVPKNKKKSARHYFAVSFSSIIPGLLRGRSSSNFSYQIARFITGSLFLFFISGAHATAPVGATPGKLEVTARGSAHYAVPITIPPGTHGVLPKLSLTYDSQMGNGFLGYGWSMEGFSVITRCGASILLDGFKGSVNYDSKDRFCMDGERLVNIGGNEYRTRHETWQRIYASDTSANPSSFTVYGKDGYILEFGVTEDSRIQAQGSANVRVWAINKMMDRIGNYYTVQYQEDNTNGDYRPDRIDYTGNAGQGLATYNSVVFQYETRSDTPPRYEAGSMMKIMQRLSHVLSYTGSALVRDYRLTYDNNGSANRSRLTSIQECGTDGVCLPATEFGWQNGAIGYYPPINSFWSTNKTADGPIGFADVDGDGKLDFFGWHSDGNIHVRRWGVDGFGADTAFSWSTNKTAGGPIGFADINGDGRADFWGWSSDGKIYVKMSNGDGTFGPAATTYWSTSKSNTMIGFADINGDRRADFWVVSSDGKLHVRISNGDGSFGAESVTSLGFPSNTVGTYSTVSFADVNGDGKADLIGDRSVNPSSTPDLILSASCGNSSATALKLDKRNFARLSNGDGTFSAESPGMTWAAYYTPAGANTLKPYCYATSMPIGDVNGDGNADIFAWLSKGNGGFVAPPTSFFPAAGGSVPIYSGLTDVNGDGKSDYYYWDKSSGNIWVRLSTGDNSFPTGFYVPWSTVEQDLPVGFADIDGDGLADLYGWSSDGNIQVKRGNHTMPDLITSITSGLGEQQQLVYEPLTTDVFYTQAQGEAYPYREVQDSTHVVRSMKKSDGLGGMVSTDYRYAGRLMHVTANENLGFGWIQRAEPDGSWVNDFYNQDLNFAGTLSESQTYIQNGAMVKHVTNDWKLGTSSYNRIMTRLMGIVDEAYEEDGSLKTRATTSTEYDGYGYPITTTVSQLDGRKKTTVNTYMHDTNYWTLGLKLTEQVTAEAPGFNAETRATSYDYYQGFGLLALERVEPTDSAYTLSKNYQYDAFGNKVKTTVSGTNITTRETVHVYDSSGRFLMSTTNALGHSENLEYDPRNGQQTKHTGPNGLVTTWLYDGFGRKLSETRADATTTAFDYSACNSNCPPLAAMRLTESATAKGSKISYKDSLNREIQTATQGLNGEWIYKTTNYDQLGRAAQVSAPYYQGDVPSYTVNEYDNLQRVYQTTAPGNRVTTFHYMGLVMTITNPLNQTTTTIKDSEGHIIESVDAASGHTLTSYDPFGNAVKATDPAGNITTTRYDRLGRMLERNDPDRGKWTYTYDVLGELLTQKDAKGQLFTNTYDVLSRLKTKTTPEGVATRYYDYCKKGALCSAISPNDYEWHMYDALGREFATTHGFGSYYYTTTRTFDAYSRLDVLTYPSGYTLKHLYDNYGNLVEMQDAKNNQSYWKAINADARGRITAEKLAGETITAIHGYLLDTGVPSYDLVSGSTGMLYFNYYTWDAGHNLDYRLRYTGSSYSSEFFGYDNLNRLISVNGPVSKTFQYDAIGNITDKSDVGHFSYLGDNCTRPHAVCSIVGAVNSSFQYDANGNLLAGNGKTVTYTSNNLPATIMQGGNSTQFSYDGDNRRVAKTMNGATTRYAGDGLYETQIMGSFTKHSHYIYAGATPVALYTYWVYNGATYFPQVAYLHRDYLGSVEAITLDGNLQQRLAYDAWGKRRNPDGTDATATIYPLLTRGYTGAEHDDESNLINLKAREYDPVLSRFLQPDPLGEKGDAHPFAYANNNPFKYIDPTGTSSTLYGLGPDVGSSLPSSLFDRPSSQYLPWSMTDAGYSETTNWILSSDYSRNPWSSSYAETSYNLNWNSGGVGGSTSIYNTVGAGERTGVPSSLSSSSLDLFGRSTGGLGIGAGFAELNHFNSTSWLADTGARYSTAFHGNQSVGGWYEAIALSDAARNVGTGTFVAGTAISGYQFYDAYREQDSFGMTKSGADVSVGAAAWYIGGKTGFGLGAAYYVGDMLFHSEDAY